MGDDQSIWANSSFHPSGSVHEYQPKERGVIEFVLELNDLGLMRSCVIAHKNFTLHVWSV